MSLTINAFKPSLTLEIPTGDDVASGGFLANAALQPSGGDTEVLVAGNPMQQVLSPKVIVPKMQDADWTIERRSIGMGGLGEGPTISGDWFFLPPTINGKSTPRPYEPDYKDDEVKLNNRGPNLGDLATRVQAQWQTGGAMIAQKYPKAMSLMREYLVGNGKPVNVPSSYYMAPQSDPTRYHHFSEGDLVKGVEGLAKAADRFFAANPDQTSVKIFTPWRAHRANYPGNSEKEAANFQDQYYAMGSYGVSYQCVATKSKDGSIKLTGIEANVLDYYNYRLSGGTPFGPVSQNSLARLSESGLAAPMEMTDKIGVSDLTIVNGRVPNFTYHDMVSAY